ncbi:hypothetical protein HMPREF9477_00701 [Lachnospiraceae bacterium 2_1_46FAA]|nr:hypothetical protein HMPREF9477_00701 [Lachnospiraceae bacterium 2_1_46FAA]
MKRVIGFALFWVAVGMLISMFISSTFLKVTVIIICFLLGYILFCCDGK